MTFKTLILRSLQHHKRSHIGVLLGAAIGSAILIGALLVGDSVRASLRQMAFARLGQTQAALISNDRLFRSALADEIQPDLNRPTAPALIFLGTASVRGGEARANRVQVTGVDQRFWKLAPSSPSFGEIPEDAAVLNRQLAEHLTAKVGDQVLLRVPKPSLLSREAPMAPGEDTTVAKRVQVHAIVDDSQFGRFSLQANQIAAFNAFVNLGEFQEMLENPGKSNLILVGGEAMSDEQTEAFLDQAAVSVKSNWTLADAELTVMAVPKKEGRIELRTDRVFLDAPSVEAALTAGAEPRRILTYFMNGISHGGKEAPYSMATGMGAPIVPDSMPDDQAIINQWLADDLGANKGDKVSLRYFVVDAGRKTVERTNTFTIHSVLPFEGAAIDPYLMPDFPGMTDAKNCRDWDTGFEMDMNEIRDKDNDYWQKYKGSPKAFVTLAAAQEMWSNRFGDLTAIRWSAEASMTNEVSAKLLASLDPEDMGLFFSPVRQQAEAAVNQSQDFGGLFIGFSFFLIFAALVLMSLLFQFGVEQRARETGALLALGFTPRQLRRLLLGEGVVLSALGSLLGLAGAIAYAKAMLWGLSTLWQRAVGTSELTYSASPVTFVIGLIAATLVAVFTIWLALRKQAKQPARLLLAEGANAAASEELAVAHSSKSRAGKIGVGSTVIALALVGWAFASGDLNPGVFFGAGALLLIAVLAFALKLIGALDGKGGAARPSLAQLGLRNAARRRKRSLAVVAMLACGSFLVVAIGAFELSSGEGMEKRSSGTGGFALIGEATQGIVHDLNTEKGLDYLGLYPEDIEGAAFVPFRVRDGEEASCLNLNRAQRPRIIGVNPEQLQSREAFSFAKTAGGISREEAWNALSQMPDDGAIPAIADQASILWAMGRKVGETFEYPAPDDHGRTFKIKLVGGVANSIMQGNLIISEEAFLKHFPSEEGYRMFLIDASSEKVSDVSATLGRAAQDFGLELTPATRRLAAFNAVQNTCLFTFQLLGGLGLVLGSVGLGVVVLRNVLERRSELALLMSVGFRRRSVQWLIISEHGALLLLGLFGGVAAALVAVLPMLFSPSTEVPYGSLVVTLSAVLLSGALWTWLSSVAALRGETLKALRNE